MIVATNVFTYWEGEMPLINQCCLGSINRVFGDKHKHLTPKNLSDYIDTSQFPEHFWDVEHIPYRVAIIIIMLLDKYGGWYMDCDVLLKQDPSDIVDSQHAYIWLEPHNPSSEHKESEQYKTSVEHPCCALMYMNRPHHPWMVKSLEQLLKMAPKEAESMEGWISTQQVIVDLIPQTNGIILAGKKAFYNFDDYKDWIKHWNGDYDLDRFEYGVHLNTSLIRNKRCLPKCYKDYPEKIFALDSVAGIIKEFPESNLAEYLQGQSSATEI